MSVASAVDLGLVSSPVPGRGPGQELMRRPLPSREEAIAEGSLLLLVEDHPVNRDVLVRALAMIGFVTDTAADAEEALDRFESGSYGLVFTDIQLPGMDGHELTRSCGGLRLAWGVAGLR